MKSAFPLIWVLYSRIYLCVFTNHWKKINFEYPMIYLLPIFIHVNEEVRFIGNVVTWWPPYGHLSLPGWENFGTFFSLAGESCIFQEQWERPTSSNLRNTGGNRIPFLTSSIQGHTTEIFWPGDDGWWMMDDGWRQGDWLVFVMVVRLWWYRYLRWWWTSGNSHSSCVCPCGFCWLKSDY